MFSVKNQIENIISFVDHTVTATTTELYHSSEKSRQHVNQWVWLCFNKLY